MNGGNAEWFWKSMRTKNLRVIGLKIKNEQLYNPPEKETINESSEEDLEDKALLESLIPEQKEWNKKGYRVCEYHSGTGDIVELTKELLIHNKKVIAEQNVKKKKSQDRER